MGTISKDVILNILLLSKDEGKVLEASDHKEHHTLKHIPIADCSIYNSLLKIGGTKWVIFIITNLAERKGYKSKFFNLVDLANQLEEEKASGHSGRLARSMEKMDILVLDELGYLPFSRNGG